MQVAVGPIIVCVSYLEKPLISTLTVNYPGITCSGGGAVAQQLTQLWIRNTTDCAY